MDKDVLDKEVKGGLDEEEVEGGLDEEVVATLDEEVKSKSELLDDLNSGFNKEDSEVEVHTSNQSAGRHCSGMEAGNCQCNSG